MLELRLNCECCNKDLPPESNEAFICTFECTFCKNCVDEKLNGVCPNCGGNFVLRPIRPKNQLIKNPPSLVRIYKPEGCKSPIKIT